ncbi:MAG: alpha/beta hydrolase [Caldilineaceae bacterium]
MVRPTTLWRRVRLALYGLLILLALAVGGFVLWATWIPAPMPEALAALASDTQVKVTTEPWLTFQPVTATATTGLIFYPGGRVDPRAYAPAAHAISAHGYLVVIAPMPLNLAVFAPKRAQQVIENHPEIKRWAIAGHSLGGAMAANFVYNHPDLIQTLILWAAYPADSNSLAERPALTVTSIYGTRDGLATPDKQQHAHALLPKQTTWVAIEGGNHAQFGWYGPQSGDRTATITREQQQAEAISATLATLEKP